ncbi:META domain-containing protein [Rhodococcus sp. IEGM 1379]|uniref:META domain-containing protein n=1 Tax=Rhodococcus sp. IEGM 1379 TaxID=3047086 RepID=UPI0024B78E9F|nr:META domain-containing protein [Rhodococcus sp. IEGM 1379]MDI9917697.1 META domain-containing protein [Rhodococcus sp. IEGM 1379]
MRIAAAVIGLLAIAAVSGCSSNSDSPGGSETTSTATSSAAVAGSDPTGRVFISTAVDGTPIPGGGPLTLDFTAPGRILATAGCNNATGAVTFTGGKITADALASTMMACEPGVMESDAWVATLIGATPAWTLAGDTLTLTTADATVTLADKKIVDPDRPVQGTKWTVTSLITPDAISTSTALEASAPNFTIAADGTVSGSSGCNRMTGSATVADTTITFTPMGATMMACTEDVAAVERQVLTVLDGEVAYTLDAGTLTLRKPDGNGLILTAQG